MQSNSNDTGGATTDFRTILGQLWHFKLPILFSILLCLIGAFLINRYSDRIFRTQAIVLIGEDKSNDMDMTMSNVMTAIGYYNPRLSYENEVIKLKSFRLAKRTISVLDFGVEIHAIGRLRTSEVYHEEMPFNVEVDTGHVQLVGAEFSLEIVGGSKAVIEQVISGQPYSYASDDFMDLSPVPFLRQEVEFGQWIESKNYRFRLVKSPYFAKQQIEGEKYNVVFRNPEILALAYQKRLIVEPTAEGASGINLILEGPTSYKNEVYLDALIEEYFKMGVEKKNERTLRTLEFIDDQLGRISDTLAVTEGALEDYQSDMQIIDLDSEGQAFLEQYNKLETDKNFQELSLEYFRYLQKSLREEEETEVIAPSAVGIQDALLVELIDQLNQLLYERSALTLYATSENPKVKELDRRISTVRISLDENVSNLIKSTELRVKDLKSRMKELEKAIQKIPEYKEGVNEYREAVHGQ